MLDLTGLRPDRRSRPAGPQDARRGRRSRRRASSRPTRTSRPTSSPRSAPATSSSTTRTSLRRLDRAVHRPGRRRPRRPDDQADALPDVGRLADRARRSSGPPSAASRSSSSSRSRPASTRRPTSSGRASWSRPGAHVVYGLVGLKTHSKVGLVVRREGSGLRRYVHIGTGNYNPKTARLYIGPRPADLPAGARRGRHGPVQRPDRPVAPADVPPAARRAAQPAHRGSSSSSIARSAHAAAGRPARIVLKLNAIVDAAVDRGALPRVAGRRRRRPHRPRRVLAAAGLPGRVATGSGSARSSASSSSTRGSGASRTAASASGTSARRT